MAKRRKKVRKGGKGVASVIDFDVGQAIRVRRIFLKMSQQQLGNALDLTFQQVQKYELGKNRLSVGRIIQIAEALRCTALDFCPALKGSSDGNHKAVIRLIGRPDVVRMLEALAKIEGRRRVTLVQMAEAMSLER